MDMRSNIEDRDLFLLRLLLDFV